MANRKGLFVFVLTVLLALFCTMGLTLSVPVKANSENPDIVIHDDFSTNGNIGISGSQIFDYSNFVTDEPANGNKGHDLYGIVPASSWGAHVAPGDAYIIYKVSSANNTILSNLKLSFGGYYGCASMGEYYGADKTNVTVSYSKDNLSYIDAFNLHSGSSSTIPLTNVVTNANNQSGISNGDTNVFGNKSIFADYTADFSSVIGTTSVMYIKISVAHLTYDELEVACNANGKTIEQATATACDTQNRKLGLNKLGVFFNWIKITADQVALDDDNFVIHHGDTAFDYGDYSQGSSDWQETAYEYGGLAIKSGVDYYDETIGGYKTPALAPATPNSEGYITYKYEAPVGGKFKSANLITNARCFDLNLNGIYEKFEYYISYNNSTYDLIYDAPIKSGNGKSVITELDLTEYVEGVSTFYLKIVIGCSNDVTWTNLKEISMDVEFDDVDVIINYGGGYKIVVPVLVNGKLDLSSVIIPQMFTREDDKLYLTSDFDESKLFDADSAISENIEIFVKGTWSAFVIEYNLDGGSFEKEAPESYQPEEGAVLIAPVKNGFDFDGWFTEPTFKNKIEEIEVGDTSHYILYAKWIPAQPNDEDMVVYYDSMSIDFSSVNENWINYVYASDKLSLVNIAHADIYGESGINVIAPSTVNGFGYFTLKFVAPNGRNFSSAQMSSFSRCFDYNCFGTNEKIDYYLSYNNYDYALVYSSFISTNSKGVDLSLDLDKYVFGKTAFYIKVVIGCTNDKTWTNLKEFSMDVEFEKVNVCIDYGNGYVDNVQQYRGETFDISNIVLPESFTRDDQILYATENLSSEEIIDLSSPVLSDITVYVKGKWGRYSLNYQLNGGVLAEMPDGYYSSTGVKLGTPTKEGFVFVGWFTDAEFNSPITEIAKGQTGSFTLYAKWTPDIPAGITISPNSNSNGCGGSFSSLLMVGFVVISLGTVLVVKKILKKSK